eukprot:64855-Amphidinium_carterae.2
MLHRPQSHSNNYVTLRMVAYSANLHFSLKAVGSGPVPSLKCQLILCTKRCLDQAPGWGKFDTQSKQQLRANDLILANMP